MKRTLLHQAWIVCRLVALALAGSLGAQAAEIDQRPLPLKIENAFPKLIWEGWSVESDDDDDVPPYPLRPVIVTHAGDGSGRLFVADQRGKIYVLPQAKGAQRAKLFLDIGEKVPYNDRQNEEGFLGLVFHPKFKENGQFFVYHTNLHRPHQNVLARYRVSKDDPNKADPNSEEILITFDKPFWNHDGGTIIFGPDGYLYVAVGDGGLANDPRGHGQRLDVLFAKILRIDVDKKQGDLPYAIPADNPFVGKEGARVEIWAYGLRNVWRMAFDRPTGTLWAPDVGQDTWEEIDLIVKGGNYGWNLREGFHMFPRATEDVKEGMIEPIHDYHHDVGKSITGGFVYRGKEIPELQGGYLYADYVSGKMWALWYDESNQRITANREIPLPQGTQVMTFGEDQDGEAYYTVPSRRGEGVLRLTAPSATGAARQ